MSRPRPAPSPTASAVRPLRPAIRLLISLALGCEPPPDDRLSPPTAVLPQTVGAGGGTADPAPNLEVEASAPPPRAPGAALPAGAPERIAARHILISYDGALAAQPTQRRTPAEARARAEALRLELVGGADFDALARRSSDDGSAAQGGDLGVFGQGAMTPAFEAVAFTLQQGELSPVVGTPFGFHVIRREPLVEVHLSQALFQWAGLPGATATRDKAAAQAQAEAARAALVGGQPLAELTRAQSDGPNATRGGELGWFQKSQLQPTLEAAAFALPPGGISAVLESPAGFHVLVRDR